MNFALPYIRGPPFPPLRKKSKIRDLEVKMKIIKIEDYYGNYQRVPVDDQFFEEWCKMRTEDHNLNRRTTNHLFSLETEILDLIQNDPFDNPVFDAITRLEEQVKLYEAIKMLTPIQRRRVYMLLDNMSYTDIARAEGRDVSVIHRSIAKSLHHLRRLMSE